MSLFGQKDEIHATAKVANGNPGRLVFWQRMRTVREIFVDPTKLQKYL
jgi:hypothetical protein